VTALGLLALGLAAVGPGCAEMVRVPAGEFWMGTAPDEAETAPDEQPRHRVTLDGFALDAREVSRACFAAFLEAGGYDEPRRWTSEGSAWRARTGARAPAVWDEASFATPELPVVGVSWFEADAYCRWRGGRLPTEAEWEKAARGPDGRRFPWGEEWSAERANGAAAVGRLTPVGAYPAGVSPYGAHDMAGNVWEWVRDWYGKRYYAESPPSDPAGPPAGESRVIRGGAWNFPPRHLRTAARTHLPPETRLRYLGFRCAR